MGTVLITIELAKVYHRRRGRGTSRKRTEWAEHATAELRRAGHRSGGARAAVIDLMANQDCCLTAQEVFDRLRADGRVVGIASVYRALDLLARLGLVRRLDMGSRLRIRARAAGRASPSPRRVRPLRQGLLVRGPGARGGDRPALRRLKHTVASTTWCCAARALTAVTPLGTAPALIRIAPVELTQEQWRALEAICDTFAPGANGTPSATGMGVPRRAVGRGRENPREAERKQVAQLLSLWDTRLVTAIGGGGLSRFSELSPERREQVLLPGATAAFAAAGSVPGPAQGCAALLLHGPGRNGPQPGLGPDRLRRARSARTPTRRRRRSGRWQSRATHARVRRVRGGLGGGGGTAAGVLATAGLDVVVVESGDYYDEEDFDGGEFEGYGRMYMYGGGAATHDQSVGLLAGSCLGGGTTINYTTSFRTPEDVREEWAAHGVPAFATEEYGAQPRRRLRSAGREPGAQPALRPRGGAPARLDRARLARGLHAAQRAWLRPG